MKAIVLAAGRGSRMNEGTAEIPKCMMTLCGRTLLERCVENLMSAGFVSSDIGIVTGYMQEKVRTEAEGVHYFHNPHWETTNMFISLTMAGEWLRGETCIVSYSDIVYHPSAVKKLMQDDGEFAITYYTDFWELWSQRFDNPLEDLETFKLNGLNGSRLSEIGAKPKSREEIQGQYMGLLRFTPSGWRKVEEAVQKPMPKSVERLDMTTLLAHLLTLNCAVNAIPVDEMWLECDNLNDIQIYEKKFAEQLQPRL